MFDIGFSELLIIAIVALVVLGPERLPKAARFAGLWMRRARAQWASVKAELERDLAAEELRRQMRQTGEAMAGVGEAVRHADADIRRELDAVRQHMTGDPLPPLDDHHDSLGGHTPMPDEPDLDAEAEAARSTPPTAATDTAAIPPTASDGRPDTGQPNAAPRRQPDPRTPPAAGRGGNDRGDDGVG